MILEAENIQLGYGKKIIVQDVDIQIYKGQIVSIIGPNGSGKSTIIKVLSRYLKPKKGNVLLENKNIFNLDTKEVARKVAVLPQSKFVPEELLVETLVSYGRYPHLRWGQKLTSQDHEIIEWALEKTDLLKFRDRYINKLSGGERQRVWLAMCLAQKPEVLILDEPTTFLDICYQIELLELIKELNEKLHLTIVMVLHDINQAARYSHKIYTIKDGRVYNYGNPQKIINQEFFKDVFSIKASVFEDLQNDCPFFIPQSSCKNKK